MIRCDSQAGQFLRPPRRVAVAAMSAALLSSILGCGVGEYRSRLEARVGELATASEFVGLYAPQQLGNKPITVRVPQAFTRPPLVAGVEVPEEGAPPDDSRVRPGIVDLPGLTYTYEEFVADAEGGEIPYYLYLSAENTTLPGFRDPTRRWLNQVLDRFPIEELAWEDVDFDTPEGGVVPWRRLQAEGDQTFTYLGKDGERRPVRLPGIFELYYRVEGDWAVTLVWRVPEGIAAHVGLDRWAPIVAGAVDFRGQTAGAGAPRP